MVGLLVAVLCMPVAVRAADMGVETFIVPFATNGVASIGIPPSRASASLVSIQLTGLKTAGDSNHTFIARMLSGGTVTQGVYTMTVLAPATTGSFTNFTAADAGGPGDNVYCSIAASNLVITTGISTNLSIMQQWVTQSTNTLATSTNYYSSGPGWVSTVISTNLAGHTNVSTYLRVQMRTYSR
jgi:hypothetical protein